MKLGFGNWKLGFIWNLEFEIWQLFSKLELLDMKDGALQQISGKILTEILFYSNNYPELHKRKQIAPNLEGLIKDKHRCYRIYEADWHSDIGIYLEFVF
ncbi:MAG: hypothetical protein GY749_01140 [Desulfobacteraceae bacterium]|nr:hypothetical protein [Desulfobacteraceae bacterium]